MTRVYIRVVFFPEHAHRATWRFFCELVLSSTNFFVSSVSSVHCELFPMETSSASTLRKVCPQCSTTVHVRRAVCGCGYAFPSKRRARPDSVSQAILANLYGTGMVQTMNRPRDSFSAAPFAAPLPRVYTLVPSFDTVINLTLCGSFDTM